MNTKHFLLLLGLISTSVLFGQYKTAIYVDQDGSADFTTIQAAIDETKSFPEQPIIIYVSDGVYEEKVKVHSWNNNLTIKGESRENTIIRWGDYFDRIDRGRNSTFHTATLLVEGENFTALNLTVENTAGPVGQAIALAVVADRVQIKNCHILGHQDTLYAAGSHTRQYYENCLISGTTDFVFGEATALFYRCTIHSKTNSFVTAASTPQGRAYGFVFLECKLTANEGVDHVFLGRPWRSYAKTVFVKCELGNHIVPEGWDNWSSEEKEKTVFYAEYDNYGPGAVTGQRVEWSHQLTKKKAKAYTAERVLSSFCLPEMEIKN